MLGCLSTCLSAAAMHVSYTHGETVTGAGVRRRWGRMPPLHGVSGSCVPCVALADQWCGCCHQAPLGVKGQRVRTATCCCCCTWCIQTRTNHTGAPNNRHAFRRYLRLTHTTHASSDALVPSTVVILLHTVRHSLSTCSPGPPTPPCPPASPAAAGPCSSTETGSRWGGGKGGNKTLSATGSPWACSMCTGPSTAGAACKPHAAFVPQSRPSRFDALQVAIRAHPRRATTQVQTCLTYSVHCQCFIPT